MKLSFRSTGAVFLCAMLIAGCGPQTKNAAIGQENARTSGGSRGFAVVELFTSQGCSSCPSADQNLARIVREAAQENTPVYALSFHVDYWNDLGWADPFSSASASQRQRQYARHFRSHRIYTPQMIVNGNVEFVGSNQATSNQAIREALHSESVVRLDATARRVDEGLTMTWHAEGLHPDDQLNIALVQNRARRRVTAGENTGHELHHVNVVRDFESSKVRAPQGRVEMKLPADFDSDEFHVVVYLQSGRDGTIRAAVRPPFSAH